MKWKGKYSLWGWAWRGLAMLLALLLLYQLWIFLHICWWIKFNPSESAFMEERLAHMQQTDPDARLKHQWVPYEQISSHLKRAVIASEDSQFMAHDGFDWAGIEYAFEKNLKRGKIVAGGSTISQQLAKNMFLSGSRTPWRKAQEAVITVMFETMMDKRRILEIYLNMIEWGNGVFGAEAAARHYFKTSAAKLSRQQAAQLAAKVPNPRFYDKNRYHKRIARHSNTVLKRMNMVSIPR